MVKLFDQFGREIEVGKQPESREVAVATLRDRWSTYPSAGLTPARLAQIFKEADAGNVYRQAELFEEMEEKDPHLFSILQIRKNAVHGLEYDIAPYSESAEDKKIRDFVADCIFGMETFDDALLDLLDAVGKGYAMSEIKWGIDGGRAYITELSWIHQKKAVFYERGGNMWQKSYDAPRIQTEAEPVYGEAMPPFKMIYHRYKARSGYDTRAGVLRVCAWMYLFKNYSVKDWSAFAEVYGMPLRVGKYDQGASQTDKDALVAAIRSLGTDAAGIISKNTEIQFIEAMKSTGSGKPIHEALAEFCNKENSKAVLGQTATTEGTPGRLGNEDVQDKVRHDLIKADSQAISKAFRFQLIRPLVGFNFGWDKPLPWFNMAFEESEDLKMLSEVYSNLSKIGQPISAEHVSERFKIPIPKKGETLLKPQEGGNAQILKNSGRVAARNRLILRDPSMGGQPFTQEQEALERLIDAILPEGTDSLAENERRIVIAIESATTFEEAMQNVMDLYPNMDMDALAGLLDRGALNAELYGRYTVNEETA